MALSKLEQPPLLPEEPPSPSSFHCYSALPSQPHDQDYVVLPYYRQGFSRPSRRVLCTASLVLLAALVYIFWPSDPEVKIVRVHVNRMQIHTISIIALDISLLVTPKVRNPGSVFPGLQQLGRGGGLQREAAGARDVGARPRKGHGFVVRRGNA